MVGKRRQPKEPDPQIGEKPLRFWGYGLPGKEDDNRSKTIRGDGFVIEDVPLSAPVSFLEFDGVILFAGAFEGTRRSYGNEIVCKAPADLDRREREFFTAIKENVPFIFLVPQIDQTHPHNEADRFDLFRRIMRKLEVDWRLRREPNPFLESKLPEFRDYVKRHGTGYICFGYDEGRQDWISTLCGDGNKHYGLIMGRKVFVLPCTVPETIDQVQKVALAAVDAVIRYRRRQSMELPEWALSFSFRSEADLRIEADAKRKELAAFDAQIQSYASHKGVLVYQSDPLVEAVCRVFDHFLGLNLIVDDEYVEDATLLTDDGATAAVFEIKGVKGNFSRGNVNQVDSHRERLSLPATTPGILIMNTFMEAASLQAKDQVPHPDIIKKAVSDHVLMMRTLDLLRFADAVERGVIKKHEIRQLILSEVGWLRIDGDKFEVVKG